MASLKEQVLRRKPVGVMAEETGADAAGGEGAGELRRSIGLFQLTLFGVGATIGTGIFIVLTQAVPIGGPAVIVSFVMAGTVAGLTAICYAELASAVPVSGSSYSYAYATLGEGVAIVVAACLLLEYGVSAAAVAVGWSQYLNELLDNLFGFTIPENFAQAPEQGGILNVPAVILIVLCMFLLLRGASESAKVNAIMVMIKLGVLLLFIVLGISGWDSDNLSDFAPAGVNGITSAAGIIFFSYIGLDAVSTAGEEVKNPRKNLPLAIIFALLIVTGIYILVTVVAVAAQPAAEFDGQEAGLAAILEDVTGSSWPATVLAAGAVVSIFSVTLVVIYGQTRILFAMGRDGMIPSIFHKLNPRTQTPVFSTIFVAVIISLLAGVLPIDFLAEMTSIGTLVAFLVVSIGVMVLRQRQPDLPRGFRVPLYPLVPIASIGGCIWIIWDLRTVTITVFLIWSSVALLWYFFYGRQHSALNRLERRAGGHAMSLLVGFAPDGRGKAVLHLAGMLARSADEDLVVCAIVPAPWYPSPARVDAEYQEYLQETANEALEKARTRLPSDIPSTFVVHDARSVPAGLLELAEQRDASLIVVGLVGGRRRGYVTLGSASSRLLYSSPIPVAIAPRGFRCPPDARVTRVTAAFGGTESAENLVIAAASVAARVGATLRLASFAVRSRAPYTVAVGTEADEDMFTQWRAEMEAAAQAALAKVADLPAVPDRVRDRDRPRRELGGGARRPRVGRRRRARRRLEHDRAGRARVPRLARREDRPPLPRPRRRRPARRGRGDRGGGEGGLAAAAQRDPRQRLADHALGDQRRVVVRADARRDDLDDVGADEVELGGDRADGEQQVDRGHAARLRRARAGDEGGVEDVDVDGQVGRARPDRRDRAPDDLADAEVADVVHEQARDPALGLPAELLRPRPVAAQADLGVAGRRRGGPGRRGGG